MKGTLAPEQERNRDMTGQAPEPRKKFLVELIKPSHYDDQGYIIQWWRGFIPSNSLSCLYGLALDVSNRRALGDDVDIDIEIRDETNSYIPVKRIIRRFKRNQSSGLVCLVGVQTNQFARAVDIAREFRVAGIQVSFPAARHPTPKIAATIRTWVPCFRELFSNSGRD
jgi:hypothetical protein